MTAENTPGPSMPPSPAQWIGDLSTELSSRRTGMAFERTRMAADRTLMAVIRTSLSLIGFGFTIFQFFQRLVEAGVITRAFAGRNFGLALVWIGILLLVLGIAYHAKFMLELRRQRALLARDGLIHDEGRFPPSLTLITAAVLLMLGIAAIASMVFNIGPFS